jgi:hypothetical protein
MVNLRLTLLLSHVFFCRCRDVQQTVDRCGSSLTHVHDDSCSTPESTKFIILPESSNHDVCIFEGICEFRTLFSRLDANGISSDWYCTSLSLFFIEHEEFRQKNILNAVENKSYSTFPDKDRKIRVQIVVQFSGLSQKNVTCRTCTPDLLSQKQTKK